jgi:flagellin
MSLIVSTNISSLNAQRSLASSGIELRTAMERLSSGKRINSAADDAAGFAIAERMTAQIRGLNMAVKNANDGLSMLSVADAAASDISDMLQRMRELAVQAANDTNSLADRQHLQNELEALTKEIDRVATQTQYNGENLIDGSKSGKFQVGSQANQIIDFDFKSLRVSSSEGLTVNSSTDSTESQLPTVNSSTDSTESQLPAGPTTDFTAPVLTQLSADKSVVDVTNGPQVINFDLEVADDSGLYAGVLYFKNTETGHEIYGNINLTGTNQGTVQLDVDEFDHAGIYELHYINLRDAASNISRMYETQFAELGINLSIEVVGGNIEPSTTNQSFSWSQAADPPPQSSSYTPTGAVSQSYSWDQEADPLQSSGYIPTGEASQSYSWSQEADPPQSSDSIPTGASNQSYDSSLYNLVGINITNSSTVIDAIASITAAIETVTAQRAEYGAMQNRLQYTVSNLMNVSEQTQVARSRIEDADFAIESAKLAKAQVLQQAATTMLAQANAQPQLALSLIR